MFLRNRVPGFTLIELMVSIAIMGIIAVVTMNDLRSSQRKDQLNNAARIIAADLRTLQAQALTGQNVKSCSADMSFIVCEQNASGCSNGSTSCVAQPPSAVGLHVTQGAFIYDEFADVASQDWQENLPNELLQSRSLPLLGARNVVIDTLIAGSLTVADADVAFKRQTGNMGINGCYDCGLAGPYSLTIRLKQTQTNETKDVVLNAVTGRISIE